jgi:phycoerythrobilin:ferredoxin oxidoreductase
MLLAASGAAGLCGLTAHPSLATLTNGGLYRPLLERGLDLFAEAGIELQDLPLEQSLRSRDATRGKGAKATPVRLRTLAFSTATLRQVRAVSIDAGPQLQVLNFCLFPDLRYGLPTFSADCVTLPGGHLIAIDCQPNGHPSPPALAAAGALGAAFARHRPSLPDGGAIPVEARRFFSPQFLWSRMPLSVGDEALIAKVLPAFEEYLAIYLAEAGRAQPHDEAAALEATRTAQLDYANYRIRKDPARPMLTSLFGPEYAERLIRELLFDLPFQLGLGGGEAERRGCSATTDAATRPHAQARNGKAVIPLSANEI